MKRILTLAAASVLALSAHAADFVEGKHYIDLGESAFKADQQVVKVYSTNCPFCFKYEKAVIPTFEKHLPDGVTYDAYHITTKPPFGVEKAAAVAVAKTLGESEYKAVKMAFYQRLHDQKQKFNDASEVTAFAIDKMGIDQATFNAKANSDEVKALLKKWDQGVAVAKVKGIPAIVVNGKYLIITQSVTSMTMLDDLTAELLAK